ncbi:hypothetical protein D3C80_1655290 [compost metagenome]
MGRDGGRVGKGIDQVVGQRQAGGGLQQQGILVAQPLGGAGTARRDGFVTGAQYLLGGELLQQGAGDQGLAHVGVGAGDEEGFNHDDSSTQERWRPGRTPAFQ